MCVCVGGGHLGVGEEYVCCGTLPNTWLSVAVTMLSLRPQTPNRFAALSLRRNLLFQRTPAFIYLSAARRAGLFVQRQEVLPETWNGPLHTHGAFSNLPTAVIAISAVVFSPISLEILNWYPARFLVRSESGGLCIIYID